MSSQPYILLDDQLTHQQRYYTKPVAVISADTPQDIEKAFADLERYHQQGYYLAGYLSYDVGLLFEDKLRPLFRDTVPSPLLQFGVFESFKPKAPAHYLYKADTPQLSLKPQWNETQYRRRFDKVMDYIEAGDVYQINLTFPMTGTYDGPAYALYAAFRHRQKGRHGGIVSLGGETELISLSPELFFRKEGNDMSMRPMKGTRARSQDTKIDDDLRQEMRGDSKSQAENLMIVDLLRNDLSRISKAGSVQVPELFALETYPTLHQMTSRVRAKLRNDISLETIFKRLFPCGSVTGAPKIRAMEIIDELEDAPRGAYCGSVGYIDPSGHACFNVSIRTITLKNKALTYNVGSGLVLDSNAKDEYEECLLKADVLKAQPTQIIETFRWEPKRGFIRGAQHKARMTSSAKALDYPFDSLKYDTALSQIESQKIAQHIRLFLNSDGKFELITKDYVELKHLNLIISEHALSKGVQNTEHKISRRSFYDGERERLKALSQADEVIFVNENGELCEGSFTSLFIEKDGKLYTPPKSVGLLAGILRAKLIKAGKAEEKRLTPQDLLSADRIYVGNSLRGLIEASLTAPS